MDAYPQPACFVHVDTLTVTVAVHGLGCSCLDMHMPLPKATWSLEVSPVARGPSPC